MCQRASFKVCAKHRTLANGEGFSLVYYLFIMKKVFIWTIDWVKTEIENYMNDTWYFCTIEWFKSNKDMDITERVIVILDVMED